MQPYINVTVDLADWIFSQFRVIGLTLNPIKLPLFRADLLVIFN
jgi:uncharacterized ubiquitin-like protein YukD